MKQRSTKALFRETVSALGWRYAAFVTAIFIFSLVTLLPASLFRYFTQELFASQASNEFALKLLYMGAGIALLLWLCRLGSILAQEWLRLNLETHLRDKILKTLHVTPLTTLEASQRGEWYSKITSDLSRVEFFLTDSIPSQLRMLTVLLGTGYLFYYHVGPIVLLPLSAAILLAFINFKVQGRLAPSLRELRERHANVFQTLVENFEGIRTIRTQRAEAFVQSKFKEKLLELRKRSFNVVSKVGLLMGTNEAAAQVFITLCLTAVTFAINKNYLFPQNVLIFPFFIGMFFNAAQELSRSAYDWNRFEVEGGRLAEFLYSPPENLAVKAMPPTNSLAFNNVRVGFNGAPLNSPTRFNIEKGKLVVFSGPSGSGKSTFLELIAGLRPGISGDYLTDEGAGSLVEDSQSLRSLCAYVEQRPYLFEGTLSENLTLGKTETDEVLWNALEQAGIDDFAKNRKGLETFISDRGENLSEGQRYRIVLARALLLNRPFLLVDEPFAALDPESMGAVIKGLNKQKERAGVVVVTHTVPKELEVDQKCFFGLKSFPGPQVAVLGDGVH